MSIEDIQKQIVEKFSFFEDWLEKYEYLIELGKSVPEMDSTVKTDENLVKGCQSQVWLHATTEEGKVMYQTDSDAILTKGIAALLVRVFNKQNPEDIIKANTDFLDQLQLKEHLSPTRANGLLSIIKQIKIYALAFKAKQS